MNFEYRNCVIIDCNKKTFFAPFTEKNTVATVETIAKDAAVAVYIDAICETGFCGEQGIRITFDSVENEGYLAIENHSDFWCRPFFGKDLRTLPARTQMLLLKTDHNTYKCYLPVCDDTYKTVLQGTENGFEAVVYSNCEGLTACKRQLSLIIAEGEAPYAQIRACTTLAAELLGGFLMRKDRKMPRNLEYLGWCSWDAFQYRINHEGLVQKAQEFLEKDVPVHFAILDDMWADIPDFDKIPKEHTFRELVNIMHQSKIRTFDGDTRRFPKGMKAAIDDLKSNGIESVGLWYPTTGYWKGFSDDSDLVSQYPDLFLSANPGRWHKHGDRILLVKPEKDSVDQFFDVLAKRAKSWGIDFIKVDNQGYHKHYKNLYPVGQSAVAIQNAIDRSADRYFNGEMINCMGMPSECMFHRPSSAVSRCSDDFMPENREWFAKNIQQCAYNGLLQGQYYINDWDMFWTDDEQAIKNSVCRAISGGPVYVSDPLGRTRAEVLLPLALRDGRILRPDQSAVPTGDCLILDPIKSSHPFKIYNRVGNAGLIAAFHISEVDAPLYGTVSAADAEIYGFDCVYYEYFTGACGIIKAGESIPLILNSKDDIRLFTVVPQCQCGITLLGRLDKFIGIAAIESFNGEELVLKEGGRIGFYTTRNVSVFSDRRKLSVLKNGSCSIVECDADEKNLRFVFT